MITHLLEMATKETSTVPDDVQASHIVTNTKVNPAWPGLTSEGIATTISTSGQSSMRLLARLDALDAKLIIDEQQRKPSASDEKCEKPFPKVYGVVARRKLQIILGTLAADLSRLARTVEAIERRAGHPNVEGSAVSEPLCPDEDDSSTWTFIQAPSEA
jgi:hypothetical protein